MAKKFRDDLWQIAKGRREVAAEYQTSKWRLPPGEELSGCTDLPEKWLSLVKGDFWQKFIAQQNDKARIQRGSNQIAPKLMARHSIITMGKTEFFCEPTLERFVGIDKIAQPLLATEWEQGEIEVPVDRCIWDAPIYSYGVCEVGWRFVQDRDVLEGGRGEPRVPPDALPMLKTAVGMMAPPPVIEEYESEVAAEGAMRVQEQQEEDVIWQTTEDDPFVERFCPLHLLVDPNCTCYDLSDARYVFRVRYEYLDRVKANSRYKKTPAAAKATAGLTGGVFNPRKMVGGQASAAATSQQNTRDDLALVLLYDGYMWVDADKDGKEEFIHIVMADESDVPLLIEECPYSFHKWSRNPYPFRVLPGLTLDNDTFYCESVVEQAAPLQIAYDKAWSQLESMRRRAGRMVMFPEDSEITSITLSQIQQGADGTVLRMPREAIESAKPYPNENPPLEIFKTLQDNPQEIGRQLGVSEFDESVMPQKQMLKAEIDALRSQGSARVLFGKEQADTFKEDIAMCILALIQEFGERKRSFVDVSPEGEKQWGSANATDLRGIGADGELEQPGIQFKVKINAANSEPNNRDKDREMKLKLLELVMQFAQVPDTQNPAVPMVNPKPALRAIVEAFDIAGSDEMIAPTLPPEEEAQAKQAYAQQQAMVMAGQQALGGGEIPQNPVVAGGQQS